MNLRGNQLAKRVLQKSQLKLVWDEVPDISNPDKQPAAKLLSENPDGYTSCPMQTWYGQEILKFMASLPHSCESLFLILSLNNSLPSISFTT